MGRGNRKAIGKAPDNFGRGREIRKDDREARQAFETSNELLGGRACGNDDQAIASFERRPLAGQSHRRFAKRLGTSNAHQACHAGGNHCSFGGSIRMRNSFCARDSIMSAPAAAAEIATAH